MDMLNTRSCIYKVECLKTGVPFPDGEASVVMHEVMRRAMRDTYKRLVGETARLVDQYWPRITRVAKHLENHAHIDDQAVLDDLIARAERFGPELRVLPKAAR